MVAERNEAYARADSTLRHRRRRRGALLLGAGAAIVVGVMTAPLAASAGFEAAAGMLSVLAVPGADASSARPAAARGARTIQPADDESGVLVRVSPTITTAITPSASVALSVEIENATGESLAAGVVRLVRTGSSIDDEAELDDWLSSGAAEGQPGLGQSVVPLAEAPSRGLASGGTTVVPFTVPGESFAELADSHVIGLGAELVVGDTVVAAGVDAFPNGDVPASGSVAVALAAPLTVPSTVTDGLIDASQLENWTGPTGLLTRQLEALAGRRVAIGIDPRIIASIRVLGTAAPATATAWLDRLASVPNEVFPLAYADADLALQAQLGLSAPLSATTFADALDPANFSTPADEAGTEQDAGDGAGPTPTASPEPQPTPGGLPTTEELLDWPYTRADIAWPADDSVAAGNLGFFDAAGLTTTFLSSANAAPVEGPAQSSANVDGSTVLVADGALTDAIRAASNAATDTEWRAAAGLMLSELALDASDARTTVLAMFDRGAAPQPIRVSALIDEVATSPWSSLAGLSDAIGAPPEARALVDEPETQERLATAASMVQAEADVTAFASVLADAALLTGPTRRDLLALLSVEWIDDPQAWNAAVTEWLTTQSAILDAVSVVPSSTINVVSTETGVPTTIENALSYPVTVVVDVNPSNGRLIVEDQVEVTVEPQSRSTVRVPVAAGVGNGEVSLAVSLSSPSGVPIGSTVTIPANVQADWEGLGAAILAAIVILVFGIGVWRSIRRRRRERTAKANATDAAADPRSTNAGPASSARSDSDEPTDAHRD
ncbi:DUF6049 family protein [Agromyces sp. Marseille-P2726]|uniref:DUF6049 family protein n=1 Tax=Agromyces sp. Marseille-P2726 TaxID=2709132 RepID=UPI001570460C|nr:DUF6049 family protein [Agromyces sp. Marseille-P2726]